MMKKLFCLAIVLIGLILLSSVSFAGPTLMNSQNLVVYNGGTTPAANQSVVLFWNNAGSSQWLATAGIVSTDNQGVIPMSKIIKLVRMNGNTNPRYITTLAHYNYVKNTLNAPDNNKMYYRVISPSPLRQYTMGRADISNLPDYWPLTAQLLNDIRTKVIIVCR
jgi:hypothetical protein